MLRYLCFLIIIIFSSCTTFEKFIDNYNNKFKVKKELINDKNEVLPIEIKMPFFWKLRPWKEGKLVTIDGWGRYAEISFIGENKVRLKHLVDFPKTQQDGWGFVTFPEAGLIASHIRLMQHLAAIDDGKTKSHVPLLSWKHYDPDLFLLDPEEGLIAYQYIVKDDNDIGASLFIYNYKTDKMIYEPPDPFALSPQENEIYLEFPIDEDYIYSNVVTKNEKGGKKYYRIFYDWKKGEITKNELTEFLNQNKININENSIHFGKRYFFIQSVEEKENNNHYKLHKIDWDEGYSNIQETDVSYFFKNIYRHKKAGYHVSNIIISSDGSWVTAQIYDLSEYNKNDYNNHFLCTRIFFHIDNKYKNGISMPVYTNSRETVQNTNNDKGAFVQHPVYGTCYAQEWHSEGKTYLRLYKMGDVLTIINNGSQSVPFYYDNSKNYLYTREYSYEKEFITGWIFDEDDTDEETNKAIDSIIKYCEEEMGKIPLSEPDNQLTKIELYKNIWASTIFTDKNVARVRLYMNKSKEDENIYYIEIDIYILSRDSDAKDFRQHKLIISNKYFKFSESDNEVDKSSFGEFYKLLEEGEPAFKFFINEMEKHRR